LRNNFEGSMPLTAKQRAARNARRKERRAQDPDHRAKLNAAHRAYYAANGEKMRARMRTYRETHGQQIKERRSAYCQANREAINERARVARQARKHANDPSLWNADLKRLYGISAAEYDALLAKQGGVCAICRQHSKRRLCVDHCHLTGTVRGLLCDRCNLGLGYLKEDQASLVAALAYLGALPRDGPGSAAQRALAVHAALPPWPTRRAVLTCPPIRCDAAAPRASGIGRSLALRPQPMHAALEAELCRASGDGAGHNIMQLIARKLAARALEGDLGAIREIFDRVDGKTGGQAPRQVEL
jgi:Recombination endonuclease VII